MGRDIVCPLQPTRGKIADCVAIRFWRNCFLLFIRLSPHVSPSRSMLLWTKCFYLIAHTFFFLNIELILYYIILNIIIIYFSLESFQEGGHSILINDETIFMMYTYILHIYVRLFSLLFLVCGFMCTMYYTQPISCLPLDIKCCQWRQVLSVTVYKKSVYNLFALCWVCNHFGIHDRTCYVFKVWKAALKENKYSFWNDHIMLNMF